MLRGFTVLFITLALITSNLQALCADLPLEFVKLGKGAMFMEALPDRGVKVPDLLIFSDSPEEILRPGQALLEYHVLPDRLATLYLYHVNSTSRELSLVLTLSSAKPLEISGYVISRGGNPFEGGHEVALQGLRYLLNADRYGAGNLKEVTCELRAGPGHLIVGYVFMRSSSSVDLRLYTLSEPAQPPEEGTFKLGDMTCWPGRVSIHVPPAWAEVRHQRGITWLGSLYQFVSLRSSTQVDLYLGGLKGPLLSQLGDLSPLIPLTQGFKGLYGVPVLTHVFTRPGPHVISVEPRGGKARVSLALRLSSHWYLISTEVIRPYEEREVLRFESPGELELLTVPEGASSYPVKITIKRLRKRAGG